MAGKSWMSISVVFIRLPQTLRWQRAMILRRTALTKTVTETQRWRTPPANHSQRQTPKQEVTSHPAQCQNTASSGGETNNEPSWRWVCCMDTFHLILSTSQRTCLWDTHTGKSSCVNISHTSSMDALYSSIVQEPQPVFVMWTICKQPLHSAQNVWPSCTSEWENVSFLFTFLGPQICDPGAQNQS